MGISLVEIYLLGRFEIKHGQHILRDADWSSRKAAVLLQRLAWERRLLKDQAIDFLWPEIDPASGSNRLYQVLYTSRQTLNASLGPGTAENTFTFADGILTLDERVRVDAHEFQHRCSVPAPGKQLSVPDLQKALDLYQGSFLPDELYADWTLAPRETLRRLYRNASLALAAHYRDERTYAEAIALLRPLLRFDPADESIHRELMRVHVLAGRRHDALRQYQACVEALEAELDLTPAPETEALYTDIIRGELTPPPTPAAPGPGWVPPNPITIEVEGSIPLVGREAEFKTLQTKIQSGWQGQGYTILLAGDAGVGKTRLAYETVNAAASSQTAVLVGAAYEQEGYLPYQPFIEAFDRYLAEHGQPLEQNPITHFKPSGSSDPQQEHSALFLATANFLQTLAAHTPVILLLDDLHAADEASLQLLHYLARQTRSAPIMLLGTYRTDTVITPVSPFGRLLNALYREHLSEVLRIIPLSEEAAGQIINHTLEGEAAPALVKVIFDIAEGNPLFIQEIIQAVLKAEQVYRHEGQWRLQSDAILQIPMGLRELIRERVQRLGPEVEPVLTAAAVIGREFRFEILQGVAGRPDDNVLDALDAALAGWLLEETDRGYRFRHSLIRHILYDVLSRRRRARLHTLTAEAIETVYQGRVERLEPHIEILAFHYDLSDRRDQALPYLLQAGRKAARLYALEVANDYFERALSLLDVLGIDDPAQRWPILEQLGWWALTLADSPRAVARFEQALALLPAATWQPDIGDRVRMHRAAAVTLITVGKMTAAEQHLRSAMAEIDEADQDTSDYAYLLYDVALWHWHRNEYEQAVEVAQQSLEAAQVAADEAGIARAYEMLALAAHSLGDWQEGLSFEKQRTALIGSKLDVTEAFDVHL